ncbi:MAG TPA: TMEM165/GDT1 family protein [Acidimicrobiales bacterium]|nr:TMEM165/GDT1 family protein [Acidimicrobiales bacterium]
MGSLLAALGLVFLAELGDKTQLVALGFGARHRLAPVLAGVVAAYMATNLLSVVVGGLLGATLPSRAIGLAGGVLFLGFAVWTLTRWVETDDADMASTDDRSVVLTVAGAMFVAELGDKTMLATATLAAQGNPVAVWIGATVGIILSGALGVLLGRWFGARLPEAATRIGSALLFAVFGIVLIVTNL